MPMFGLPLNALLFWLVLTKTPKEMWVHSRILLQTCVVDLILLLVNLVAIPVSLFWMPNLSGSTFKALTLRDEASLLKNVVPN
jgi:hypothetical protein